MKVDIDINIKVSPFVKKFIFADLFLIGGWGLVAPLFSIFIIEEIRGATLVTVGIATAIYWVIKSIIQVPMANFLDKTDGEKDDFYVLIVALLLASATAFSFTLITEIWHLYAIQVLHAVAFGLYVPAWTGMFSRHLDKKHEALDWSLNSATIGIASGITGIASGILANAFGFSVPFILAALLSIVSALAVMAAPDIVFPPKQRSPDVFLKDHAPLK